MNTKTSRRDFLKTTATATTGISVGRLIESETLPTLAALIPSRSAWLDVAAEAQEQHETVLSQQMALPLLPWRTCFRDRLEERRGHLQEAIPDQYMVADDRCYSGFDAYKELIDSDVDLVILATPPGFRPLHFKYAVEAGKHVFMEKPAAVDPVGIRSIIESGNVAAEKGLSVVAGTLYRRQPSFMEAIDRIHQGRIGKIVSAQDITSPAPYGFAQENRECPTWNGNAATGTTLPGYLATISSSNLCITSMSSTGRFKEIQSGVLAPVAEQSVLIPTTVISTITSALSTNMQTGFR